MLKNDYCSQSDKNNWKQLSETWRDELTEWSTRQRRLDREFAVIMVLFGLAIGILILTH